MNILYDIKKKTNSIKIFSLIFTILIVLSSHQIFSQDKNLTKLKKYFDDKKYEKCYSKANDLIKSESNKSNFYFFKVGSFAYLPSKHELKAKDKDWLISAMEYIEKTKKGELEKKYIKLYKKFSKKVQRKAYKTAEKHFKKGNTAKAMKYFALMNKTFDNSSIIYKNYFGNDEVNKKFEIYLNQISPKNSTNKLYTENKHFAKWNNPKYRMANTAKSSSDYTDKEKMVFYFLNLFKMNPKLFGKTYIRTYILLCANKGKAFPADKSAEKDADIKAWTDDPTLKTLIDYAKNLTPKPVLFPDSKLFESAKCWAKEAGRGSNVGHDRGRCEKYHEGECCAYSKSVNLTATEIVLYILHDNFDKVPGQRKELAKAHKKMGVSIQPHYGYKFNAVLDFGK